MANALLPTETRGQPVVSQESSTATEYLAGNLVFGITEHSVPFQYVQLFEVCYLVRICGTWKN